MLVSGMSGGGATGMSRSGSIRMCPDLGVFYCIVIRMSATQCLRMDLSPDRPVISKSACSGGSCACCRGVGARVLHPMELEGEA